MPVTGALAAARVRAVDPDHDDRHLVHVAEQFSTQWRLTGEMVARAGRYVATMLRDALEHIARALTNALLARHAPELTLTDVVVAYDHGRTPTIWRGVQVPRYGTTITGVTPQGWPVTIISNGSVEVTYNRAPDLWTVQATSTSATITWTTTTATTWTNTAATTVPSIGWLDEPDYAHQVWRRERLDVAAPVTTEAVRLERERRQAAANERAAAAERELRVEAERTAAAIGRARALLASLLTAAQRAEMEIRGRIPVTGSAGTRFELETRGTDGNILWFRPDGALGGRICAHPRPYDADDRRIPLADLLAGQVLALRTDERALVAIANVFDGERPRYPDDEVRDRPPALTVAA